MRSIVVIPALNEETHIPLLLEEILSLGNEAIDILVVDDQSTDQSASCVQNAARAAGAARTASVKLITNPWPEHGLAYCYKAGFEYALKNGYDAVICMDADGSHDPLAIPRFLHSLVDADWVVGSRYIPQGSSKGLSFTRLLISRFANFYIGIKLKTGIRDMTSGFNCFKADVLKRVDFLSIGSKGFVFQVEMKYRALMAGFVFKEMPIQFHHRYAGRSKFSLDIVFEAAFRLHKLKRLI